MKNLIVTIIIAVLFGGCIGYPYTRNFKGPKETGYDRINLQDSVRVSISYMEVVRYILKTHQGASIMIKTFDKSKLPLEVNFDSLRRIRTKFFDLELDSVQFSDNGIRKGNIIFFSDSYFSVHLTYHTKDFKIENNKHYSETQKVWIPSFTIKQGGKEYVTKGFEAVYPKH